MTLIRMFLYHGCNYNACAKSQPWIGFFNIKRVQKRLSAQIVQFCLKPTQLKEQSAVRHLLKRLSPPTALNPLALMLLMSHLNLAKYECLHTHEPVYWFNNYCSCWLKDLQKQTFPQICVHTCRFQYTHPNKICEMAWQSGSYMVGV